MNEPTEPTNALNENGNRYYIHPITTERFLSVTTALSIIDKEALPYWYGKQSAIRATMALPRLIKATRIIPCAGEPCGQCLTCLITEIQRAGSDERDLAASKGTRFHWVAKQYALTGGIIPHDKDIHQHVINFLEFVKICEVEFLASEVTVLNRSLMVGGTLDGIIKCNWMSNAYKGLIGKPMLIDYKTANNIYPKDGLQLAAYNNAETVLLDDGTELPMPDRNPDEALSIQIKAEGWWVRRCPTSSEVHQKFERTVQLWRDINEPDIDLAGRAMLKPRPKKTSVKGK